MKFEHIPQSASELNNRFPHNRPVSAKVRDSSHSTVSGKSNKVFPGFRYNGKSSDFKAFITHSSSFSKSQQKRIYEENLSIKMKTNTLNEENIKLKTKISQIEKSLKNPEDPSENSSLVVNLKKSIQDLKAKLNNKQMKIEKLRKNKKNCQTVELNVEVQTYTDECTRLRHHLEEIMKQKNISFETLEFEERLFRQNLDIETLRRENLEFCEVLSKAREEIFESKAQIAEIENSPNKRKNVVNKTKKLGKLKSEISELRAKIVLDKEFFVQTEESLIEEAKNIKKINEGISKKLLSTESKLHEQNIILDQLKNQLIQTEKGIKRAQTIIGTSKKRGPGEKFNDPPKLFQKIFNILHKKKMMIDVFFSLMDKNSNGIIDIDEIQKTLKIQNSNIKKKYIVEAFQLMEVTGNSVPVSLLEEYYDNYEYEFIEDLSSSEEEVVEVQKKVVERLTYNQAAPEIEFVSDTYTGPFYIKSQDVILQAVDLTKILNILKDIQIKMQKKGLKKEKLIEELFGPNPETEKPFMYSTLADCFFKSSLELKDREENKKFSQFLIQPDDLAEYSEYDLKNTKQDYFLTCRKVLWQFEDWKVYSENQFYHVKEFLKDFIETRQVMFLEMCKVIDGGMTGMVKVEEFRDVCRDLGLETDKETWEMMAIECYPARSVKYQEFLCGP